MNEPQLFNFEGGTNMLEKVVDELIEKIKELEQRVQTLENKSTKSDEISS